MDHDHYPTFRSLTLFSSHLTGLPNYSNSILATCNATFVFKTPTRFESGASRRFIGLEKLRYKCWSVRARTLFDSDSLNSQRCEERNCDLLCRSDAESITFWILHALFVSIGEWLLRFLFSFDTPQPIFTECIIITTHKYYLSAPAEPNRNRLPSPLCQTQTHGTDKLDPLKIGVRDLRFLW